MSEITNFKEYDTTKLDYEPKLLFRLKEKEGVQMGLIGLIKVYFITLMNGDTICEVFYNSGNDHHRMALVGVGHAMLNRDEDMYNTKIGYRESFEKAVNSVCMLTRERMWGNLNDREIELRIKNTQEVMWEMMVKHVLMEKHD